MRAAILQMTSSDRPEENLATVLAALTNARAAGADMLLTPEVTNCLSTSRSHQREVLHLQDDDPTLAALRQAAADQGLWLLIGSLALKTEDADGRFANRSFVISDTGEIKAWYDKIHMFDVNVDEGETYRESEGYRPGDRAVIADNHGTGEGRIKARFELVFLTGWAPHDSQQKPLRPGSAAARLAEALETTEFNEAAKPVPPRKDDT